MPPHVAIVGDAIFGRLHRAWQQSWIGQAKSTRTNLSLPPATLICPDTGPMTTVVEEKENNPFF